MALGLETKTIPRRSHVRAAHLINGGVYRPRRYRRGGKHRSPSSTARAGAWVHRRLGGDRFTIVTFYTLLGAGTVLSGTGLILRFISPGTHRLASGLTLAGTLLFVFAAALIGFCYLDPSPEE